MTFSLGKTRSFFTYLNEFGEVPPRDFSKILKVFQEFTEKK